MSEWIFALVVCVPLAALAWYDWDTAKMVRRAEVKKPAIPFLTGVKLLVYGVVAGSTIAVVLGVNSAVLLLTGLRLLPPPSGFILLYLAVIAGSVGCYFLRRRIKRLAPEVEP